MIDHSLTYKRITLRNVVHIARLKKIISIVKSFRNRNSFLDIGCSNGYITNIITKELNIIKAFGCDHNRDNLVIASKNYPNIHFYEVDLNKPQERDERFDLITCFETLEHVGNLSNALQNILNHRSLNSKILISVPVETGLIGICKFLLKVFYNYKLTELDSNPSRIRYFFTLINPNQSISIYRNSNASGYSTHFGFDYKRIEAFLHDRNVEFKSTTFLTTKFYLI